MKQVELVVVGEGRIQADQVTGPLSSYIQHSSCRLRQVEYPPARTVGPIHLLYVVAP